MDKHYLTPLFAPQSILVFAGSTDSDEGHTLQAMQLAENLKAQDAREGIGAFLDKRPPVWTGT